MIGLGSARPFFFFVIFFFFLLSYDRCEEPPSVDFSPFYFFFSRGDNRRDRKRVSKDLLLFEAPGDKARE